jgi:hypothetical protein
MTPRRATETPSTPAPPTPRRPAVMTEADWRRVERDVRRGAREPDPAQITFLADEPTP